MAIGYKQYMQEQAELRREGEERQMGYRGVYRSFGDGVVAVATGRAMA
jgi:hypothetical protein